MNLKIESIFKHSYTEYKHFHSLIEKNLYLDENLSNYEGRSRLVLSDNNTKSEGTFTMASLLSPKIQSAIRDSHGVCLQFNFHLTGQQTQMSVLIERKGNAEEILWKLDGLQRDTVWKEGRVWLGVVSQLRVLSLNVLFLLINLRYKVFDDMFSSVYV